MITSILLYTYLAGVLGFGAAGTYGCATDAFASNHAHGGVEGPLCYGLVAGTSLLWPIPAALGGFYLITE